MRIGFYCLMVFLFVSPSAFGQSFFPVKVQEKWGLMNADGKLVLAPEYDAIGEFKAFGYAVMQKRGRVGLLGPKGKELVDPIYEDLKILNAQFISVRSDNQWRVINLQGKTVLDEAYEDLRVLGDNLLAYHVHSGWGVIDDTGKKLVPAKYDRIHLDPHFPFFRTTREGMLGLVKMDGTIVFPTQAEEIRIHQENLIFFQKNDHWGIVNGHTGFLLPPRYQSYEVVSENFVQLRKQNKAFLYSVNNQLIVNHQPFDAFYLFSEALAISKRNRKLGILDAAGREILGPHYQEIQAFGANRYRVNRGGKWGVVGSQDSLYIPFNFDYIGPLQGSICLVRQGRKFGVTNKTGYLLLEAVYDRIEIHDKQVKAYKKERLTLFQVSEEGFLLDEQKFNRHLTLQIGKKTPPPPAFETAYILDDFEWFYSSKDDLWGLRSLADGSMQIEPSFDRIIVYPEFGFTLVGIKQAKSYDFDRTSYRFEMAYGVVANDVGLLVSELYLWDIRLEDFRAGQPAARCIFSNGRHGLIAQNGKILRKDFAYIGPFENGLAPVSVRGKLSGSMDPGKNGIEPLHEYLNGHLSNNYLTDYTLHDLDFAKTASLTCKHCVWGYMDTLGQLVVVPKYAFAQPFVNEVGIVQCDGKWGMVSVEGKELIQCTYDRINFLENTDNKIVQLFKEEEKYGLIDTLGRLKVRFQFDEIGKFSEGRLAVKRQGLWGFVDRNGLEVIPCRFTTVGDFSEGLAAVKIGPRWGFIDKQGNTVIEFNFTRVGNFKNGLAWFLEGGRYGYIDPQGSVAIPVAFSKAYDFEGQVARVVEDQKYGLIDVTGKYVMRPKYSIIYDYDANGLAKVCYGNERIRYGIIDQTGMLLTSQPFRDIKPYREGMAAVKTKDGYGFINLKGRLVVSPVYSKVSQFSDGRASVQKDGQCGYIDKRGEVLVDLKFSKCLDFADGKAVVYRGQRKAGVINEEGGFIIEPSINYLYEFSEGRGLVRDEKYRFYYITAQVGLYDGYYEKASPFQHGVAVVQLHGKWGVINQKGIEIIPPKYDKISQFENGYAKVRINGFNGLSNLKGEVIVQPDYEYISYAGEGLFRVEQGDKVGYFDVNGDWVWGLQE